jgi:excisionase family DNA binding protein
MNSRTQSSDRQTADSSEAGGGRSGHTEREFYTIEEMADALNVTDRTVRRWIKTRKLISHRFGRLVRIAKDDLLAFLAVHREG